MKKLILFLSIGLMGNVFSVVSVISPENNQVSQKNDGEWRIGGKIHFEENRGQGYIGIQEINRTTRIILKEFVSIYSDSCVNNAKIVLKKEDNKVKMTHFEEKSRPGIGEEMHATLLYTQPRGFHNSETLKQVCNDLFEQCEVAPTIEHVAEMYGRIIRPEWKFKIEEIILTKSPVGPSFIMAKLLFNERENIYKLDKPISAGLHMTLANIADDSILVTKEITDRLIEKLNNEFRGKMIKVASKNDVVDLEFGISGSSWRIRAGQRIEFNH